QAVAATLANARANGLATRVVARRGTLAAGDATYRLILANLVASTLIELASGLADHTAAGGALVGRGIIGGRSDEVLPALAAPGLRVRDGAQLVLLDGLGEAVICRLEHGECLVESRGPAGGEAGHHLTIWQALLRGDHLEPVIRHGTEIGIWGFRLLVTERCVV